MQHNSYYDGLSEAELAHDNWLIVAIELLWYCKLRKIGYIRYNQLKTMSNEVLNVVTKGERPDFGGSFDSIINSSRCKRYWRVDRNSKNVTLIFPNIREIQNELEFRKAKNFDSRNKQILRIINKVDKVLFNRSMNDSLSVTAGVAIGVKRANPDEKPN